MLSPADHLAADELEDPGGMTWREVKDFLDHMRETCIKDRQELKLEVRRLRGELANWTLTYGHIEEGVEEIARLRKEVTMERRWRMRLQEQIWKLDPSQDPRQ